VAVALATGIEAPSSGIRNIAAGAKATALP
jgi:hypothetical protein